MTPEDEFEEKLYRELYNASSVDKETAYKLARAAIDFFKEQGYRSPKDCEECEGGL